MTRSYDPRPTMRLACVALALLASTSIGLFIDVLARDGGPAQHTFGHVVIAKAQSSR